MSQTYPSHCPQPRERPVTPQSAAAHKPQAKRMALLTMRVEEADVLRVRRALSYTGAHAVEFVKITRIPRDNRVCLQIGLEAEAVSEAMDKVIRSVTAAELGPIRVL